MLQAATGAAPTPAAGTSFDGIGQGFKGPSGSAYVVNSAPPDTNGAVGPNNYVQVVNSSFAIFDKTGKALYGPAPTNTLWSGFGGGCEANDDGDAIVSYDRAADRWLISQFAVTAPYPFLECVAVSATPDPTGSYYRYAFQYNNFADYPKIGIWPDGYYATFNLFSPDGTTFLGPEICAYDRARMLTGTPATQQCFTLSNGFAGLLPSQVDGATQPPAGAPNYVLDFGTNNLELWKFHVDWTAPAKSTLTGPVTIPVAPFTPACRDGGGCIPQPGTTQTLDSLGDRLMSRVVYRNFGTHESLLVTHSINAGTSAGVRWYELRSPGSPTVYQQGTYAPDAAYRWMSSAAMDGAGNVGVGYSVASSSIYPGLRYTGHLTTDPPGVMGQAEGVFVNGAGSQLPSLGRWGDYSSMTVDPKDDCTFWFTSEYQAANGTFNWRTRIGSFRLSGCGATADFSLAASPASQTVTPGQSTSYAVTLTPLGGFSSSATLSVSGLPAGATASFSPNPTATSSTLTVTTTTATPAGNYPLTISGSSGALTRTASTTLVVQGAAPPTFTLSASPGSKAVARGGSTTYQIAVTPANGFNGSVALSVSGLPTGAAATFTPNPATSSSTLKVTTNRSKTKAGTSTLTITGTSGSITRTTTVTLKTT